ncbi:MAG: pantoate--beta-alanine ligase, partial [Actinomycetota bacterium]
MTLLLVRHADAGDRAAWTGDDRARPLSATGREQALAIPRALHRARELAREGSLADAIDTATQELKTAGIEPEYFEARHADDLTPVTQWADRPILI